MISLRDLGVFLMAAGIVYFLAMGTLMWIENRQWQRKLEREQKQEIRERLEWYRRNRRK